MISRIFSFKYPVSNNNNKNHKAYKEIGKYDPFKGDNKLKVTVYEEDLIGHILDKN